MTNKRAAIFLDRDGTINTDHGYVSQIDDFHFIEGVIEALAELKKMGFLLVIVTNQSGIARGKYTEAQFMQLTEWMDWSLADKGVDLDGIYYCPHHPEGEVSNYVQSCDCRKPQPGMLLAAANALNIDLAESYMVGDKLIDIQAGDAAGVKNCILVRSGKPVTAAEEQVALHIIQDLTVLPDFIKQQQLKA